MCPSEPWKLFTLHQMSLFKKWFSTNSNDPITKPTEFSEGDIFFTRSGKQYHIHKLLVSDKAFDCYHVLSYVSSLISPDKKDIDSLEVQIYHRPISKQGFKSPILLANRKVTANDLIGYHEYLRQIQTLDYQVSFANQYYLAGLRLTDEEKHYEAIEAYSKAIDMVPGFFEAIDNRAFCKMDIGRWTEAIEDFNLSLEVNPDTLLAEFSIGECYLRLGDLKKAKQQFEKASAISPDHQGTIDFLKRVTDLINNS